MDDLGWLHIYAQALWHDYATIAGDRRGIELLRDALTAALKADNGVSMAVEVFTNDGEGYYVNCHVLPEGEFQRLATPYTDEIAKPPKGAIWPHMLPVRPVHPHATRSQQERQDG